jgi:hypothetical protein
MGFEKGHTPHNKGREPTSEERERLKSIGFKNGHVPFNKGKTLSAEHKRKLLIARHNRELKEERPPSVLTQKKGILERLFGW